jgi:2-polyprenyl-6-methoxyphenol hydroxylase-like FAD-dependent oxidoreductase
MPHQCGLAHTGLAANHERTALGLPRAPEKSLDDTAFSLPAVQHNADLTLTIADWLDRRCEHERLVLGCPSAPVAPTNMPPDDRSNGEARHAVVVGGGIGGLATAVALRQTGWRVTVVERSAQLREVGAGISLWPNAIHALWMLGLKPPLQAAATVQEDARIRTWQGKPLAPPLGARLQGEFGAPPLMLHRAALQNLLIAAARPDRLLLGSACVAVEQDAGGARAHLDDGSAVEGDIIVGADGIHSLVRNAAVGAVSPQYSGYTAWRGVVPVDESLLVRIRDGEYFGPGCLFGMASLGGSLVYWWASRRCPERPGDPRDDLGDRPEREKTQLLRQWGSWVDPIPDLLDATPAHAIIRTPLDTVAPLRNLNVGRIAFVGDAAHAMMPNLGQGACQAIEDAAELAQELDSEPDVTTALARYSTLRSRRTAAVVRRSRQMSVVAHLNSPIASAIRNAALRATPTSAAIRRLAPVVGYRVAASAVAGPGVPSSPSGG